MFSVTVVSNAVKVSSSDVYKSRLSVIVNTFSFMLFISVFKPPSKNCLIMFEIASEYFSFKECFKFSFVRIPIFARNAFSQTSSNFFITFAAANVELSIIPAT